MLDSPSDNKGWNIINQMLFSPSSSSAATPLQFCNGYSVLKNSDGQFDSTGNQHQTPDCTIFAMNTYDDAEALVNAEHLNILDSHCADEFTMPSSSWERNASYRWPTTDVPTAHNDLAGLGAYYVAPQSLVQQYYKCFNSIITSLALAFGSSAGTAGIAGTVVVTVLVALVSAGWFKDKAAEDRAVDATAATEAEAEAGPKGQGESRIVVQAQAQAQAQVRAQARAQVRARAPAEPRSITAASLSFGQTEAELEDLIDDDDDEEDEEERLQRHEELQLSPGSGRRRTML